MESVKNVDQTVASNNKLNRRHVLIIMDSRNLKHEENVTTASC